jgi:hypothetical protein
VHHRASEDQVRYGYDKDVIIKKYEEQTEEYMRLRANYNGLLEQKTRLEEELSHLYATCYLDRSSLRSRRTSTSWN